MQSQLYLAILKKAFPAGPQKITGRETKTIRIEKPQVVHFLSGSMLTGAPLVADISVNRISPHSIDFNITKKPSVPKAKAGSPIQGVWSDEPRDDSTKLNGWAVNYFPGAANILRDNPSIHTIGDIREDLRYFNKRRAVELVGQIVTEWDAETLFSNYYLSPKPELITQLIELLGSNEAKSNKSSRVYMLGFYSRVFHDNSTRHAEWKTTISQQNAKNRELLTKAMEHSPELLISEMPINPALNDMLWGIFFASGDIQLIHTLIDQLQYLKDTDKPQLYSTAMTAKWSLAENARFYPTVKQLIVELRETG